MLGRVLAVLFLAVMIQYTGITNKAVSLFNKFFAPAPARFKRSPIPEDGFVRSHVEHVDVGTYQCPNEFQNLLPLQYCFGEESSCWTDMQNSSSVNSEGYIQMPASSSVTSPKIMISTKVPDNSPYPVYLLSFAARSMPGTGPVEGTYRLTGKAEVSFQVEEGIKNFIAQSYSSLEGLNFFNMRWQTCGGAYKPKKWWHSIVERDKFCLELWSQFLFF